MKLVTAAIMLPVIVLGAYAAVYWFHSGESGESFVLNDEHVIVDFGYAWDGDQLTYCVIRSWPDSTSPEQKMADTRSSLGTLGGRLVRNSTGLMEPVKKDGRVYLWIGDELRTFRVDMSEHTDTMGLWQSTSVRDMEAFFAPFRID